jgi:hypothetical protein
LADDGILAAMFSTRFCSAKLFLPMGMCRLAVGQAELHAAALDLLDHLRDVLVVDDRTRLGAGHETAGTQHRAKPADHAHHGLRGDDRIELHETAADALRHFFATHVVGTGLLGGASRLALGEDQHPDIAPRAMGQCHDPTHLLIGVARVHSETQVQLHGFIEFGVGGLMGATA